MDKFQSAPLTDVRGDSGLVVRGALTIDVSIRSPHGCKGRSTGARRVHRTARFQSAPLTDVRGDVWIWTAGAVWIWFQSAPLTDVRGDQLIQATQDPKEKFQSAPLTDVRGDSYQLIVTRALACFNPLPSRM